MKKPLYKLDILTIFIMGILTLITLTGLLSFNADNSYLITNQYGHSVRVFGSGIYAHDSFLRAPIFTGSDCTMLFLVVPLLAIALIYEIKSRSVKSQLFLSAILATVLYYATSIVFGITYNSYQLLYIALFACSFFALVISLRQINTAVLRKSQNLKLPSKGIRIFLILSGVSLFIAWLPDIIPTIITGNTLPLIEVYTTEITYVLDMGIISPLMFICLFLLKKGDGLGDIILAIVLTLSGIMGVMLPVQTVFQLLAGIAMPVPVLITKVGIFVILAVFATYFNVKLFRNIKI